MSRDETTRALQSIAERVGGKIVVLVSNGAPAVDIFLEAAAATGEDMLQSVRGLVLTSMHAIQAWLPLAGPDPVLLSTNTCFAHWAVPKAGMYSFGRAALLRLTDQIQAENKHLRAISIQPGWVATAANGFQKAAPDSGPCLLPSPAPMSLLEKACADISTCSRASRAILRVARLTRGRPS